VGYDLGGGVGRLQMLGDGIILAEQPVHPEAASMIGQHTSGY
jgi:hypothetical protein